MIPQALEELASDPAFWSAFHWETEARPEFPQLEGCLCRFPVAPGAALTLSLNPGCSYFSLALESPLLPTPVEIAWDDQAHFHRIEALDRRETGFDWIQDSTVGWVPTQPDREFSRPFSPVLYSLRTVRNAEFPFKAWNAFVAEADARAARAHAPPSGRPSFELRRRYQLEIWTRLRGPESERELDETLGGADLGTAMLAADGFGSARTGLTEWVWVTLQGDFDAGLALLRGWLREQEAPPETKISCEGRLYPL